MSFDPELIRRAEARDREVEARLLQEDLESGRKFADAILNLIPEVGEAHFALKPTVTAGPVSEKKRIQVVVVDYGPDLPKVTVCLGWSSSRDRFRTVPYVKIEGGTRISVSRKLKSKDMIQLNRNMTYFRNAPNIADGSDEMFMMDEIRSSRLL